MPSMDAWFDATVDSSLRAGTAAAARVVPKPKAHSPSTCLSPEACRQIMHVQADVQAGDAHGSPASSRSILSEGARDGRGRGKGKGKGRGKGKGKGRGRLSRPRVTVQELGGEVDYSSRPMQKRPRDRPRELPIVPIGQNANTTLLRSLCPNQHYPSCFQDALRRKYVVHTVFRKGGFFKPTEMAAATFPACKEQGHRTPAAAPAAAAATDGSWAKPPSFVDVALEAAAPAGTLPARGGSAAVALAGRLRAQRPTSRGPRLSCDSGAAHLDAELLVLLGVPSFHDKKSSGRRAGARLGWMQSAVVGARLAVCFLVSAHYETSTLGRLEAEAARHGDLLFLPEHETPAILTHATRYSKYAKKGRGMPTFKQFAFFRHAAALLPSVPFVGKLDDDSALNPPLLLGMLEHMTCKPRLFIGSINWASVVPRAENTGVRLDRCGFGWSMVPSLNNFGTTYGSHFPACDSIGGVPPFPYAMGAGYIFSSALLRWVATDPKVVGWVEEARGAEREALQWQKFEDTSTGYWLTYSPEPVEYVDIGAWIHDMTCHVLGEEKRQRVGLYHPPSNSSVITHNLKMGGQTVAWELMQPHSTYDHQRCKRDWPNAPGFL